jgi:hypothetical protein
MIFVYDKNNDLKIVAKFHKKSLAIFYEYLIRAISKESDCIKFPNQTSRIESDFDGTPKLFTIKSSIIDRLIGKN